MKGAVWKLQSPSKERGMGGPLGILNRGRPPTEQRKKIQGKLMGSNAIKPGF